MDLKKPLLRGFLMRLADEELHVVLVNAEGEDIIDANGRIVIMPKLAAHVQGRRHRAVSAFIFSSRGEVMLQKRAANKYHSPGLWSNTCCTHPKPYESPADAVRRRLDEEMGLSCPLDEVFTFTYSADVGNQLIEEVSFDTLTVKTYDPAFSDEGDDLMASAAPNAHVGELSLLTEDAP